MSMYIDGMTVECEQCHQNAWAGPLGRCAYVSDSGEHVLELGEVFGWCFSCRSITAVEKLLNPADVAGRHSLLVAAVAARGSDFERIDSQLRLAVASLGMSLSPKQQQDARYLACYAPTLSRELRAFAALTLPLLAVKRAPLCISCFARQGVPFQIPDGVSQIGQRVAQVRLSCACPSCGGTLRARSEQTILPRGTSRAPERYVTIDWRETSPPRD